MTEKKLTINELRAGTKSSRAFRIGVVAVIAAVAAAGVWYFGFADKVKAPTYRTVEITRGPLEVTVVANGTVNPVRTVSIGSELSGIVRNESSRDTVPSTRSTFMLSAESSKESFR